LTKLIKASTARRRTCANENGTERIAIAIRVPLRG
jgi:hypothetical protein